MVSDVLSAVDVCFTAMGPTELDYDIFKSAGFVQDKKFKSEREPTLLSWTLRDRPMVLVTFKGDKGEPNCGLSLGRIASQEFAAMLGGIVRSHGEPNPKMSDERHRMWVSGRKIISLMHEGPAEEQEVTIKVSYFIE